MNDHRNPHPARTAGRRARRVTVATCAVAIAGFVPALLPAAATSGNPTTDDVIAWFQQADPTLVTDTACALPAGSFPVVYTRNRVVTRTTSPNQARTTINSLIDQVTTQPNPSGGWILRSSSITLPVPPVGEAITPVWTFDLKPRNDGQPHNIVRLARSLRANGITASPDYGMVPTPYIKFWPAGPPTPAPGPAPQRTATVGGVPVGTGITIDIYDTGLADHTHPGLLTDVTRIALTDREEPDTVDDDVIDYPHAGHGLAMAGVIKTLTPGAKIREGRISDALGLATDVSATQRTINALKATPLTNWPSLIVYAFGSTACDRQANQPLNNEAGLEPLALQAVLDTVTRFDAALQRGMLVVASAGNRATTQPFFPAAFNAAGLYAPSIVSVGAYDATKATDGNASAWFSKSRTGPVSDFSNTGPWVETFAPGDNLATTHLSGLSVTEVGGTLLSGAAYVSGTSFAAPYVAALIAEQMTRAAQRARPAWGSVKAKGAAPSAPCDGSVRPIGPGVAVGLTSITGKATGSPTGPIGSC